MVNNRFLKVLSSFPVILIFLYYIPFLAFFLLLLRLFIYRKQKSKTPMFLIILGILILIPKFLETIFKVIKFDSSVILYFDNIISSDLYVINFVQFGKNLLVVGTIYLILSIIFSKITNKVSAGIRSYISESEKKDYEISQKNDLLMKEKREKALNTHVVKCPYCGYDNIITEKMGTCKFCRRNIEYK